MTRSERVFNFAVGLSLVSWSVLGIATSIPEERTTVTRLCISLINLAAGLLFIVRSPLVTRSSISAHVPAVASLLSGGLAFKFSYPLHLWPIHAQIMFAIGTLVALVSILYLGRYFAVLPAYRGIVTGGPYRFVRHPVYAGELMMILGCTLAGTYIISACVFACAATLTVLRIRAEEDFLGRFSSYGEYAEQVSCRLLPGLW
ncbi:methyltransferase family protein [Planctomycetota bacterium]